MYMMIVTAAIPSSPKNFMMIRLNKKVVIPVDISVNISLLPFVQDLKRTVQFNLGLQNLIWLYFRKYPNPISILTVMERKVPQAAPSVPMSNRATKI